MRIHLASFLVLAAACADQSPESTHHFPLPFHDGVVVPTGTSGNVPSQAFSFAPGTFNFTGPTAPGTGSVTSAPVADPNNQSPSYGTGAYDVTISGTHYTGAMQSEAMSVDDRMGSTYLVFGGYNLYTDASAVERVDQLVVIVEQSDFAVGGTVALDGVDRVALFATGPTSAQDPDLVGYRHVHRRRDRERRQPHRECRRRLRADRLDERWWRWWLRLRLRIDQRGQLHARHPGPRAR
jgi:hypothetical protein